MQRRGGYHAYTKDEQCFCAAKALSRPCLLWVIKGRNPAERASSALHPKAVSREGLLPSLGGPISPMRGLKLDHVCLIGRIDDLLDQLGELE